MYEKFINLYPISKTLRFELKPMGKTLDNMRKNGIIEQDEHRAESYKKAKELIDEYHKNFIEYTLQKYIFNSQELNTFYDIFISTDKDEKDLKEIEQRLRKDVISEFKKQPQYKKIFGKEMINECLPLFIENDNNLKIIDEFKKFTTYFTGFNENRKNMYSDEEKSTSIAYRIVNQNLPIFIINMKMYKYVRSVLGEDFEQKIYKDLEEIIQVTSLREMFSLEYFNDVLTQKGIEVYNQIIGGITLENGTKVKGINEYINEYRQTHSDDKKIGKLNFLYKQILSETNTASFVIDKFENDVQLTETLEQCNVIISEKMIEQEESLQNVLKNFEKFDMNKIYIKNDLGLTNIAKELYGDWNYINTKLQDWYDKNITTQKKINNYDEKRKAYFKSISNFPITFLNDCISKDSKKIENYFMNSEELFDLLEEKTNKLKKVLKERAGNIPIKQNKHIIMEIKEYLDSVKAIQWFIKPLIGARYEVNLDKDNNFYDKLYEFWDVLQEINSLYNKVRNYLTGKAYSTSKIKLNFNNSTLLAGWDVNKENENKSVILIKDNLYYLAIMDKNFKGTLNRSENNDRTYKKMEYKLLPGPNKMLPKVFLLAKSNIDKYQPDSELLNKYQKGFHKKGENFDLKFCHELIDFFKKSIEKHEDWKNFKFVFSETNKYKDISEFYKEVEQQGYKIAYSNISEEYINNLVNEGKVYLFQLYNKDFSSYSHGKPNLHTLYWKMLFDKENSENVVYKLNGEAEIFYRKASIEKKITHPKNQKIKNKNILNSKSESVFEYDLIKDKRFTEEKFQFHVPITLNFKNVGISNINEIVNKELQNNNDNYIIGIDRGERNLIYLVLINSKGEIVEQFSLNKISNSMKYETDYHKLLDNKEIDRNIARESWQTIENIKELKEGYLSQVINIITNLMLKYNAIIVLENLNSGFKNGRQKIEKQVYQKFEKMLIDKLNYLVKKDINSNENGGLLKAYQLTNNFESFKKLGKQSGVLFYVPAWNTSKIDPTTGFVNLFYIKYENEDKAKEFVKNFDDIKYNKEKKYFEFYIDYNKFGNRAEGTKTKWTICTNGIRICTFRNEEKNNQWDEKEVNLTDEMKKLLLENKIQDYINLKEEILKIEGKEFWKNFLQLFKLTLQMRNSIRGSEEDKIISPVQNKDGVFFNSDNGIKTLPNCADANGAYNIARKGLLLINQIKKSKAEELKRIKLNVLNKDYLNFIQEQDED